jgi:Cu(I)/Ag(I) efflux system membrane fusion protein
MDYVAAAANEVATARAGVPSAGAVGVSPGRQQLIGVRVSAVEETAAAQSLRILGRVAADETRVYTINAGIEGFVRDVAPVTTGSQVRKHQVLATFSAPDAIASIQAYIVALNAMDHLKQSGAEGAAQAQLGSTSSNFQQRLEKLLDLGMSSEQIGEIARTRKFPTSIRVVAPADGFVAARSITPGLRFERGAEWYRIVDLKRVWILADVFGSDARFLVPGARAEVILPDRGASFTARVTEILPQFDPVTRTLKVRLEVDNPDYVLRPDMFVDVKLPIARPRSISVPLDAIVDSGLRKTVFVESAAGLFEPRDVQTGWRSGDRVEIVEGLARGERIVTAGTFLLDSESRMQVR